MDLSKSPGEKYAEFRDYFEALTLKWPGCLIPPLPGKKIFAGTEQKVVEERLKFLNAFCNKLIKLPHLYYSTEMSQIFLKTKDQDATKLLSQVQRPSSVELIQKYQIHFEKLAGKDIDAGLMSRIAEFTGYVKKSLESLENYKRVVEDIVETQNSFNSNMVQAFACQIPDYEKSCQKEYCYGNTDLLLLANPDTQEKVKNDFRLDELFKQNNLQLFMDLIKLEIKDCRAYLEAIQAKEGYEQRKTKLDQKAKELQIDYQNLLQGKTSFKSFFQKGTQDENKQKLEQQIKEVPGTILIFKNNAEIENLKVLIDILIAILGFIEIDNFKQEKALTYKQIMTQIAELQMQSIEQQMQFWLFVQDKSSQLLEKSIAE